MTYDVGGRAFAVHQEGDDFVVLLEGKRAGVFVVERGVVKVQGRYMNVVDDDGVILAVAKQFLRAR